MENPKIPVELQNKIEGSLKYGEVLKKIIDADVVAAVVIIEDTATAVCRFYLRSGRFIGEVPALSILADFHHDVNIKEGF